MNQKTMTGKIMDEQEEMLLACIAMLETYVPRFPAATGCVKLNEQDRKIWQEKFYPNLVEGGPKLPDNLFFDPTGKNKKLGIGTDAAFSGYELFQFLYRLYQSLAALKTFDR